MLIALLLACGIEVHDAPPAGTCPDWEAILTPKLEDFTNAARPWLLARCRRRAQPVDQLPAVASVFGTVRSMLEALVAGMQRQ
jgi:hypothetical protein